MATAGRVEAHPFGLMAVPPDPSYGFRVYPSGGTVIHGRGNGGTSAEAFSVRLHADVMISDSFSGRVGSALEAAEEQGKPGRAVLTG